GAATVFDICTGGTKKVEEPRGVIILKSLKEAGREIEKNSGASLIDLGDGVVCCEFHAKMNAIGADLIAMMHKGLKRLETDFDAMVIANQAVNFSVGANLMLVLVAAQEQEWDELHMAVKQFQNVNLAIKYAPKPVVAAPQGMALVPTFAMAIPSNTGFSAWNKSKSSPPAACSFARISISLVPPPPGIKPTPVSTNPMYASAAA